MVRLRADVGECPAFGVLVPYSCPEAGTERTAPRPARVARFTSGNCIDVSLPADMLFAVLPHRAFKHVPGHCQINAAPTLGDVECVDDDPTMRHLCLALLSRPQNDNPRSLVFERSLTLAMLAYFIRRYCGSKPTRAAGRDIVLEPWQLKLAEEAILDCLHQPLRISVVAERCGVSPEYFSRAFRSTTSETPCRWLMQRRVERACQMIKGTDERLADIALACGFADQSHLTRTFTTVLGITPSAWRTVQRLAHHP